MTSPESTAIEPEENAFEAPKADLTNISNEKPVLEFERFTAWAVFGLSIITLGIYAVYWLYSRTQTANSLSKINKLSMATLNTYLTLYIAYTLVSFFVESTPGEFGLMAIASVILSIAYFVYHILTAFGLRKVITEIINEGSQEEVKLGGVLTFFFSSIYFQYKINEAIDAQSDA